MEREFLEIDKQMCLNHESPQNQLKYYKFFYR